MAQCFARVQLLCRKEHLQSTSSADLSRQPLRASPSGDETERCAAMSEDGVGSGDAMSASHRQVESTSHAVAVNSCDGGGGEAGQGIHELLSH